MEKRNLRKKSEISQPKLRKKSHISYSQIVNGECLYRYKMINLLGKIKLGSVAMTMGSIVHQIIHDYTKQCVEERMDSDFELLQQLIDKYFDKSGLPESQYSEMRDNLIAFAEKGVQFDTILDYEKKFHVDINSLGPDSVPSGKEPIWVDGIIDRVNCYRVEEGSVIEFPDYKNQMNIASEVDVIEDLQLRMYRYIGCTHLYPGYDLVRTGIHHTRYNYIRWTPYVKISELYADFESMEQFLQRQWNRLIKTPDDEYVTNKGEICWRYGGCDVMLAGKCPEFTKAAVEKKKKGNIEDMVRVARKIDIERKDVLDKLKDHFREHEPIAVDGKPVGFKPSFSYKYDLAKFDEFTKRLDIPLSGITVSKKDAEKAVKKVVSIDELSEEDAAELKDATIETSSNKFNY